MKGQKHEQVYVYMYLYMLTIMFSSNTKIFAKVVFVFILCIIDDGPVVHC